MKKFLSYFTIVLVSSLVAAITSHAVGSSDEPRVFSFGAWIWHAVNFAIFASIAVNVYQNKVVPLLKSNRASVKEYINRASSLFSVADRQKSEILSRLGNIDKESAILASEYQEEGRKLASKVIEEAREEAKRIVQESEKRILNEGAKASDDVKNSLLSQSLERSRLELGKRLNSSIEESLREEALSVFLKK